MRLAEFALRRLVRAALVLWGISLLVFALFFLTPGVDPAARLAGRGAPPEALARIRAEYGLDRPVPVQYATLMRRLLWTRDLPSFTNPGQLVVPTVLRAAPVTLALAGGAALLFCAAGLAIGLVASRAGRAVGGAVVALGLLGVSVPAFWLGGLVSWAAQGPLHGSWLAWVPPLGTRPATLAGWLPVLALPCLTLAVLYAGIYGRVLRTGLLSGLRQDYSRTARAKGLSETRIVLVHALPNALPPAVALLGLDLGALVGGGTVLVEVVFGLPGLGRLTFDALRSLDLATVMACVLYASAAVVAVNAAADLVTATIDPAGRS